MAKPNKKHKPKRQAHHRGPAATPNSRISVNQAGQHQDTQLAMDQGIAARFQAHDTWFFRESRPHDAVGASELASLFPPPVRTLAGALRTFIGEQLAIDWQTLTNPRLPDLDFTAAFGDADDLGALQLQGAWIVHDGQRLYPVPLYLLKGEKEDIQRLQIGQPVRCDLGTVRLPQLPSGLQGYKTLEQCWLTGSGLAKCLNGQTPAADEFKIASELFHHEARLGIACDNPSRAVQQGKLYQTRHLRLQPAVAIELLINGLPPSLLPLLQSDAAKLLRLGGEGRMAGLSLTPNLQHLPFAQPKTRDRLIIHFLTPADFAGHWCPADFTCTQRNGQTEWQGVINGIELNIEAAVIGKVQREGGWDMQCHQPRPVKSYIPAGSAWFCRLTQAMDWNVLMEKLHGQWIGEETAWGRGQIAIGHWQDTFNA